MAHEDTVKEIEPSDNATVMLKTIEQQLTDANDEISDLRLQIAWLERSYE
jgi:hypothetical protein